MEAHFVAGGFSSGVGEALAYAAAIARENGARLHILHGINGDTVGSDETSA
ncbi:MAG: hypothetical protein U1F83_20325 [Verrucomicrobiota bacterium]